MAMCECQGCHSPNTLLRDISGAKALARLSALDTYIQVNVSPRRRFTSILVLSHLVFSLLGTVSLVNMG